MTAPLPGSQTRQESSVTATSVGGVSRAAGAKGASPGLDVQEHCCVWVSAARKAFGPFSFLQNEESKGKSCFNGQFAVKDQEKSCIAVVTQRTANSLEETVLRLRLVLFPFKAFPFELSRNELGKAAC